MRTQLHTILGGNGAIGQSVIKELTQLEIPWRSVSRTAGKSTNEQAADLLNQEQLLRAIKGSSHVYLCVGLPYQTKTWLSHWPTIMENTIHACQDQGAPLIYLDNVYMYASPLPSPFSEETRQDPSTGKGIARKRATDLLVHAINQNKINGVVGRAADFLGPGAVNSAFYISFLENMLVGKQPLTLGSVDVAHTYANTIDIGKSLVDLAMNEDCYGQVWHLPVGPPTTTNEMLKLFNDSLGTSFQVSRMPTLLRKALSLFISPLKEVGEMLYQFDAPYLMSDEKFRKRFPDFKSTPYQEVVEEMVNWFQSKHDDLLKSNL